MTELLTAFLPALYQFLLEDSGGRKQLREDRKNSRETVASNDQKGHPDWRSDDDPGQGSRSANTLRCGQGTSAV